MKKINASNRIFRATLWAATTGTLQQNEAAAPSAAALYQLGARVLHAIESLDVATLTPEERSDLGHLIFDRSGELSSEVSLVLCQRPGAFPDLADQGQAIAAEQAAADGYRELARLFAGLAAACEDGRIRHQARAVMRALQVIDQTVAGARTPALQPQLRHRCRIGLLTPALRIWREVRGVRPRSTQRPQPPTAPAVSRRAAPLRADPPG